MTKNPFSAAWVKEEDKRSAELEKAINKALTSSSNLAKIDKATTSPPEPAYPPPPVAKLFDKIVADAVKAATSSFKGMDIKTSVQYKIDKQKWRASATATATFVRKKVGAKKIVVKKGDTLFNIAKAHYGDGVYYPIIAENNPNQVKFKGNFIVAHSELQLPAMDVLDKSANTDWVRKSTHGDLEKYGQQHAEELEYAWVNFDLSKSKEINLITNTGFCALKIKIKLKGTINVAKDGVIKHKFDENGYKAELAKELTKHLSVKVELEKNKPIGSISTQLTGAMGSFAIKIQNDLTAVAQVSSPPIKKKIDGYHYSGKIGADISLNYMCVPRDLPEPVRDAWKSHDVHGEIMHVPLVVTGGVVVVGGAIVLTGASIGTGVLYGTAKTVGALGAL